MLIFTHTHTHTLYPKALTCGVGGASSELTEEDVRTAIKNSAGVKGTLMLPDAPFELLVRRAISRLLTPALQCKEFVHSELLRIAGQCAPPDIARFPSLQVKPACPLCAMCSGYVCPH